MKLNCIVWTVLTSNLFLCLLCRSGHWKNTQLFFRFSEEGKGDSTQGHDSGSVPLCGSSHGMQLFFMYVHVLQVKYSPWMGCMDGALTNPHPGKVFQKLRFRWYKAHLYLEKRPKQKRLCLPKKLCTCGHKPASEADTAALTLTHASACCSQCCLKNTISIHI